MITAAQCRSARTLLGWPLSKLAAAALVSETDIDDFELERRSPQSATVNAVERAFAAVGVVFSPDGGVRLVSPGEAAKLSA
jgi:transcriptional regulator with XRE-family HTH domain